MNKHTETPTQFFFLFIKTKTQKMRKINNFMFLLVLLFCTNNSNAQTNTFPTTGNVGVGTLSPTKTLQVIGGTQLGGKKNNVFINSGGKLSFKGTGTYYVDTSRYVFQNSGNSNYGLYLGKNGQGNLRYEFRDQNAAATFYVEADNGNGYISGNLGIGVLNPITKLDVNGDINISSGSALKKNGIVIMNSDSNFNVFVGEGAGLSNISGKYNMANGYQALYNNIGGSSNIANGYQALYSNLTGVSNNAIGMSFFIGCFY